MAPFEEKNVTKSEVRKFVMQGGCWEIRLSAYGRSFETLEPFAGIQRGVKRRFGHEPNHAGPSPTPQEGA